MPAAEQLCIYIISSARAHEIAFFTFLQPTKSSISEDKASAEVVVRVDTYTLVFGLYRMCWRRKRHFRTELNICLPLIQNLFINLNV